MENNIVIPRSTTFNEDEYNFESLEQRGEQKYLKYTVT
jgi:hypothetical protein